MGVSFLKIKLLSNIKILIFNMLSMRNLSYIFIGLLLFSSCGSSSTNKEIKVSSFPVEKELVGKWVSLENSQFPDYIGIVDSFILTKTFQQSDSFLFQLYNKNSHKQYLRFGKAGKGPNEFLNPKPTGQVETKGNKIGLWVNDLYKQKYMFINLTQTINDKKTIIDKEFITPKEAEIGLDAFILKNNDIAGTSMSEKGRLFYYNHKDKTTKWVEYFPKVTYPPVKEEQLHNLYSSTTRISPNQKYIVSALRLFKRIDVFNDKLDHIFSITFKDSPKEPNFFKDEKNPIPNNLVHYYTDLFLSSKYIYALNSAITQTDLSKENDTRYSEVQVFTYTGDPIALYKLDHFIGSFTVDEENGIIWGISMPKEDLSTQIVSFNIK
jgi:hypothetical protein